MSLQRKTYLAIIVSLLLILLLIVSLLWSLLDNIKKNSKEIILKKQYLTSLEEKAKSLEQTKALYQTIKTDTERAKSLFVSSAVPIEMITFLEKLAQETDIKIEIFSLPPTKSEKDSWPSFVLQLNLKGPFPSFLKFLKKLENSPYLIEVTTLDLKKTDEKEVKAVGGVVALLDLKVFSKK